MTFESSLIGMMRFFFRNLENRLTCVPPLLITLPTGTHALLPVLVGVAIVVPPVEQQTSATSKFPAVGVDAKAKLRLAPLTFELRL